MRTLAAVAALLMTSTGVAFADPDANADDQKFLRDLHNTGMVLNPGAESIVINNAHAVCAAAWRGEATDDIAAEVDAAEPNVDLKGAKTFVSIALMVYCPNIGARS